MNTIRQEKVHQASAVLRELQIDAWLTFVRETTESGDPVLPMILGQPLTWQSALIVTANGDRIAIVGKYEDEAVRSTGAWETVIPYVEGIRQPLLDVLSDLDPKRLALNFAPHDVKADGLSHGMYLLLQEYLEGTPFASRIVSAGGIINRLRGRKTSSEIDRIRRAIATTDAIFAAVARYAEPGRSESDIARFMHDEVGRRGVDLAWDRQMCPIVTTGPGSMVGHGVPSDDLRVTPGNVFHVDFGVRQDEYCSDIQRAWYVPEPGGASDPPPALERAFDAIVAAIQAAANALKPGALGWEVDDAARSTLTNAGFPPYQHATGHHVGRAAHDGGGVLGPRWERYGRTPYYPVEVGNVVTLELGVEETGVGYLGLEEMVLVTEQGAEWLSQPQKELMRLGE